MGIIRAQLPGSKRTRRPAIAAVGIFVNRNQFSGYIVRRPRQNNICRASECVSKLNSPPPPAASLARCDDLPHKGGGVSNQALSPPPLWGRSPSSKARWRAGGNSETHSTARRAGRRAEWPRR